MDGAGPRTIASRLALYADAARGARARQIAYRARRLVPPRVLAAGSRERAPAAWRPLAAGLGVIAAPQSGPQDAPEHSGEFAFVGASRSFEDRPQFWRAGAEGLLFAFHLHGFAELSRYAAGERTDAGDAFWVAVTESWLTHAGQPVQPGWHPHPVSGRIMAWCAALSAGSWPAGLEQRMLRSLARQTQVLRRSVEHDVGGNHVLHNAAALCFAGVCLGEPAVERRALALLRRELAAQLLADGGHEERSTAYHRAVREELDDVAALLVRAHGSAPTWLDEARERMAGWERSMRGPDGALPLLNDAWEGPAQSAAGAGPSVTVLRESGYVVLRHAGDQLIVDAGVLAPPHLPPHAHADALSFVLWADGAPLVVDPGTFSYTGPERPAFRGTAAHNTVEVDGTDQCEFWGDFRAAFLPRIVRFDVDERDGAVVVAARHDGYRRLEDPVEHERWFCWIPADGLVVVDVLHAGQPHRVRSRLHVAPGVPVVDASRLGPFELQALSAGSPPAVVTGRYAPYLGSQTASRIVERADTIAPGARFGWALLRPGAGAALEGRTLTVTRRSGERVRIELR